MHAFTLIEIMVSLAIIAILYAMAKPGFKNFIATARRAEAQNMLAHIGELQRAYRQEEGTYYYNNSNGSDADISKHHKYGNNNNGNVSLPSGKKVSCHKNGLYLHVDDCEALRYWYWIVDGTDHGYVAVAHSHQKDGFNNIYPGCATPQAIAGTAVSYSAAGTATTQWNKTMAGDMFVATDRKGPELYIDVIKGCK